MKRLFFHGAAAVLLLLLMSGCYMLNSLILSDTGKSLEGLWVSGGWYSDYDSCYYDFRSDSRVFVTEWTDDVQTTWNLLVPIHFIYSENEGSLKMSQYMGIASFEFSIESDSDISGGYCHLRVRDYSSDFDYDRISYGEDFHLYRVKTYSREIENE